MSNRPLKSIKHKWIIQWTGITALGILIWWGGPLLTVAGRAPLDLAANRLLLLLLVVIFWLTYHLVSQTRANQTDLNLMAELSTPHDDPMEVFISDAKNEEATELKQKFQSALKLLKESQNDEKLKQKYLYALPWYVIIGAPGSGKTTLLTNSGIRFPIKEKFGETTVRGVGGTRNCTWLFSDEAIFIDTAGRYTTQDSHKAIDSAAWEQFLDLLKKYRPQRPLNGVMLTVSLADMLTLSEEEMRKYARKLRRRSLELYNHLGVEIPTYLILTKCDLVAGFTEFFEDLDLEKREQVWGFTFPNDPRSPLETAPTYLEKLLVRLERRCVRRIQEERDLVRKGLIFDFPQQLELLKPLLLVFLEETFHASRYEADLLLRGVYFTSGTQEGSPIDRIASRLTSAFGLDIQKLPDFSGHVKSYFISDLISDVILPESELAGVDKSVIRRRRLGHWAANGALIGLLTVMIAMWSASYSRNQAAVGQVEKIMERFEALQVEALQDNNSAPAILLDRLTTVASAKNVFQKQAWWEGFGLYQGKKLEWGVERIYRKLLVEDLLGLIRSRLESTLTRQINMGRRAEYSKVYELLKSYLMLGLPEKMEPVELRRYAQREVVNLFAMQTQEQKEIRQHLDQLFRLPLRPVDLDQKLVADARSILYSHPLEETLYASLKGRFIQDRSYDFRLTDILTPDALSIMTTTNGKPPAELKIPGWYTVKGYREVFGRRGPGLIRDAVKQSWVAPPKHIPGEAEFEGLFKKVQTCYFEEYQAQWQGLLDTLKIKSAGTLDQVIHITDSLAGPETPLKPILRAVYENTALVSQMQGIQKSNLPSNPSWYGPSSAQAALAGFDLPASAKNLERHFSNLTRLIPSDARHVAPLDQALRQLAHLRNAYLYDNPSDTEEALRQSRAQFKKLPEPLKSWLLPLTANLLN